MPDPIVCVQNLSKRYRIGGPQASYQTVREAITGMATAPFRRLRSTVERWKVGRSEPSNLQSSKPSNDMIWALKDVSFEVVPGEVVGIIGRNGAGKSTLLKILSRITEPTEGRVELHGRLASLLEVGTGFHPELTGRENISLNGAILGMKRAEIERKFDEIVAFAEIEKFLDTPVKRYSSGMYVRLAFAVAAHLEPEILLVDEVLAVGDAAFQKKCLGKMGEVARKGRTVLFVSHNMGAIAALCERCLLLGNGGLLANDQTEKVIGFYLNQNEETRGIPLSERTDRTGNGEVKFTECRFLMSIDGPPISEVFLGDELFLALCLQSQKPVCVWVGVTINDRMGRKLIHTSTRLHGLDPTEVNGQRKVTLCFPEFPLVEGFYNIELSATTTSASVTADRIENAATLQVMPKDIYDSGYRIGSYFGVVHFPHYWLDKHSFSVNPQTL